MNHQIVSNFAFANFILAVILATIFVTIMSLLKEPLRQKMNAGLIALWFFFGAPSIFDFARKKLSIQIALVLLTTMCNTFSAKSQVVASRDSLVNSYEQGSIMLQDKQYLINGASYKMGFMQRRISETLKKSPMAYAEFELFKKNQNKSFFLNIVGGGAAIASILINQKTDKALFVGLSAVGLGLFVVSLPLTSKSKKHFNKAIWLYNRDVLNN